MINPAKFYMFDFDKLFCINITINTANTNLMHLSSPLIPLEMLAASFRTTTHDTQGELRAILRKFITIKNDEGVSEKPLLQMLSEGKQELLSLKRKLSEKFEQQYSLYDNCKKRIHRHEELKADNQQKIKFQFNSHIIQYLHSKKDLEKAKLLSRALKEEIMFGLETSLLERTLVISEDILSNKFDSLKQWIHVNHHNLEKNQNSIHFQLTCCEFINLIFEEEQVKACMHLRNRLKNTKLNKNQHKIVEKLTYLLIDSTSNPPNLQQHLKSLQSTFKKAFFQTYLISFESQLEKHLIVGISSLKTVCCCKAESKNQEICPICTERASQLAERIPMLTKESSSLKCRINQSIMDEQNYPIALPSGNIYSISGLNSTSEDDQYYCINTETWYPKGQAKKVFLA